MVWDMKEAVASFYGHEIMFFFVTDVNGIMG